MTRFILTAMVLTASFLTLYAADNVPDPAHETEQETISKCLADLSSPSADVRRRAVLILGKYTNPGALSGIIQSLNDTDAGIRRSALVSLTERASLSSTSAEAILQRIDDPDVHIRRIVSSYLRQLLSTYRVRPARHSATPAGPMSPALQQRLVNALRDADTVVRRNMVAHFSYLKFLLTSQHLVHLLGDTDREVRILALDAAKHVLDDATFIQLVSDLVHDSDRLIRLRLAKILAKTRSTSATPLLRKLSTDEDFEVSTEALLALFTQRDFSHYSPLRQRLDDIRMDSTTASLVISQLRYFGVQGNTALVELIDHPNPTIKDKALQTYGQGMGGIADVDLILRCLQDASRPVRDTAGQILLRLKTPPRAAIGTLASSNYADIRLLAVDLAHRLPGRFTAPVLLDLILDDDFEVRMAALSEIIRSRPAGWEQIIERTLDDDNFDIRLRTITMLTRSRSPEVELWVRQYHENTANTELKRLIQSQLKPGSKR